jgi:hypothetical protein
VGSREDPSSRLLRYCLHRGPSQNREFRRTRVKLGGCHLLIISGVNVGIFYTHSSPTDAFSNNIL